MASIYGEYYDCMYILAGTVESEIIVKDSIIVKQALSCVQYLCVQNKIT